VHCSCTQKEQFSLCTCCLVTGIVTHGEEADIEGDIPLHPITKASSSNTDHG
jgi:hypothetical protein